MDQHQVSSRDQLVAAICASAHDKYEAAKVNPFIVILGRTKYIFREGVTTKEADRIRARGRKLPASAFKVKETPNPCESGVKTNHPGVCPQNATKVGSDSV